MNATKNKEIEKDWLEIFDLIDEEEIKKAESKVYFIKILETKESDRAANYCEGM